MGKKLFKRSAALVLMLLVLSTGLVANAEGTYTVERGDYLKKIAQSVYGDSARWEDIYEANKASIKNPNILYKGQVLILPDINPAPVENPEEVIPAENPEGVIPAENPGETVPAEDPQQTAAAGTVLTLEQWTMSQECREIENLTNEIMKELGLTVSLRAEGNTLVYTYNFGPEIWGTASAQELAAAVGGSDFEALTASMQGLVDELRREFDVTYGIKIDKIRYTYLASDGTPFYSAEL